MSNEDWRDITHTGPGTLAGRYLRLFWQPIFRAQDLQPRNLYWNQLPPQLNLRWTSR